jgi:hypothetical protein
MYLRKNVNKFSAKVSNSIKHEFANIYRDDLATKYNHGNISRKPLHRQVLYGCTHKVLKVTAVCFRVEFQLTVHNTKNRLPEHPLSSLSTPYIPQIFYFELPTAEAYLCRLPPLAPVSKQVIAVGKPLQTIS